MIFNVIARPWSGRFVIESFQAESAKETRLDLELS